MKNILHFSIVIIFTLILAMGLTPLNTASAAGNTVVSVSAPGGASAGTQFTVSINVEPGTAIAGVQFNLAFDPALVTATNVAQGNLLTQGGASTYFNPGTINNTTGTIRGVAAAITTPGQTVSANGTLATITLTTGAQGGTSALTLSGVVAGNINGQSVAINAVNSQITITQSQGATGGSGGGGGGGGGSSGGGSVSASAGITSLLGSMTADGLTIENISASDINLKVELRIPKGTIVRNRLGQAATSISIMPVGNSLAASAGSNTVSQSYAIEQSGTTFAPSANLIFKYSDSEIAGGIPAGNLYIALWNPDTAIWTDIGGVINTTARTVTVPITHLSTYALLAHSRPADISVSNLILSATQVTPGETVTGSIVVSNHGNLPSSFTLNIKLDDTEAANKSVTLNGGGSETVVFTLSSNTIGEHKATIGNLTATYVVKQTPSSAGFTVSQLNINPLIANSGDTIEVSAVVNNTGSLAATYRPVLSVDDVAVETKEVTLEGGGSQTVTFSFTAGSAGQHKLGIGGLVAPFEVKTASQIFTTASDTRVSTLGITSFSAAPGYDKTTNTLVDARIVFKMNQSWDSFPDARLIMTVLRDNQLLEKVSLFSLNELQIYGQTGELGYIPIGGWEAGEYTFQAELYTGESLIQDMPLQKFTVTPEATAAVVSWKTLGIIIGSVLVLGLLIVALVLHFRRDMLRDYWK